MKRILICFSYKGTNFAGYQIQNNGRTVQEDLQNAIKQVINQDVKLIVSGRTDAKVHAIRQYAHFDCDITFDATKLVFPLNDILPNDIKVISTKEVDCNFNANFDVKKKTYMYVLKCGEVSPMEYDLVSQCDFELDIDKMRVSSSDLIGLHNFKSFCASKTSVKTFEREIYDIQIVKEGDYLKFFVTGNGFLYNMVRIIVGTLVDIGRGKLSPQTIKTMLSSDNRNVGGRTAQPQGLYLYDVEY